MAGTRSDATIWRFLAWTGIALAVNLAGSLIVYRLVEGLSQKDDFPGEALPAGLAIYGTMWAGVASFATTLDFVRRVGTFLISPLVGGLSLALVTLPLSALVNFPSATLNPVAALNDLAKYSTDFYVICLVEYFVITAGVGAILMIITRRQQGALPPLRLTGSTIAVRTWLVLAIFYVLQLPVALAVSGNLRKV